ncbi:MAG: hypothetical protein AAGB00_08585 [Planctomycetota bacterium]
MPQRTPRRSIALAAAALLGVAGGCNPLYFRTPNLLSPGPAGPQQVDAIYHDPYPLDDVGPEVVGGRPRNYQRPVPETLRGKLLRGNATTITPAPTTVVPPY